METSIVAVNPPLLPYEKDLIELLGCTEEEFRVLVRFAQLKAKVRPADYAHIPDVRNEAATIIAVVSLVIGLASTAISLLLRPEIPEQNDRRVRREQLPDQVGPSRFNQTSSFDGYASLVEYGTPVPVPFGKMGVGADGARTGGLVLAGSLVWSRAYSYGSFQRAKLLYTLGQWSPAAPVKRGVWLGTSSLSALGNSDFALYWKSREGENRIQMSNRIAGTQGTPDSGDPETQSETFIAPVDGTIEGPGFCMVYNPQSASTFGQYNPLPNGAAYRQNWEVISILRNMIADRDDPSGDEEDAVRRARAKRVKNGGEFSSIVGFEGPNRQYAGQPGVGRGYSTQMGLVAYAPPGADWIGVEEKLPELVVGPGTRVRYRIHNNDFSELDSSSYFLNLLEGKPDDWGIDHDDIKSAVDARRIRGDDLMVVGSKWMIGQTLWVVESRSEYPWRPGGDPVVVTLVCKGSAGSGKMGIAGARAVKEPLAGYEGPWIEKFAGPKPDFVNANGFNTKKHCGANFWPLVQYEVASVRMVRAADTIEFGIKSVVWNRANGLCNFNGLLKPSEMAQRDKGSISLNTPTMSRYFKRTSCFSIWVRPVAEYQTNETDESQPWDRLDQVICVTGESPREMFNYIRIRPRTLGRYEFRFIPRTGADIAINSNEGAVFWQLNAASGRTYGEDLQSDYGAFRVTFTGNKVTKEQVTANSELLTQPEDLTEQPPVTTTKPTSLTVLNGWSALPSGLRRWYRNAWLTEILGSPFGLAVGTRREGFVEVFKRRGDGSADDGYIKVGIAATVNTISGPAHLSTFGTNKNWAGNGNFEVRVIDDGYTRGQWAVGDQFVIVATMNGNPYGNSEGYSSVSCTFQVSAVATSTTPGFINLGDEQRAFELSSQVSDWSHYDEIEKSCNSSPEHQIVYVNEAVSESTGEDDGIPQYEDLAMLGLTVKSSPQITNIEQPRVWMNGGVQVERLTTDGVEGVSNLFTDLLYYFFTDKSIGIGDIVPSELVDRESFRQTGLFLEENKIHCNGVVEAKQNIRAFATEQAPRNLCIFTIKNGVFGMQPALPIDSAKAISTQPIQPAQIFSKGNILSGSFKLTYQNAEELRRIGYSLRWRFTPPYELPDERTAVIYFKGAKPEIFEDLDLTQFCDNEAQAMMIARYTLASRRYTDHQIEFQTTPEVIGVEPGGYIRVMTEEIDFNVSRSLVVKPDLTFTSAEPISDGTYNAFVYQSGMPDAVEREIKIQGQKLTDESLTGAIISLFTTSESDGIYQVQELTLDENGIVSITAVVVPTEDDLSSKVAYYTVTPSEFEVEK